MVSALPDAAASISGVDPVVEAALALAPASSSAATIAALPSRLARKSGV